MTVIEETTPSLGGMTLSEMETALSRYGFNSSDPLAIWINAAMRELESVYDWPWLESVSEITGIQGDNSITLPEQALKIISLRDTTNLRKLMYFDRRRFAREVQDPTESGKPDIYTLISTNEVQLWRVPDGAYTYEVVYQALTPTLVNPEDTPSTGSNVWPALTHYPIVHRAAAIALQAENEEERSKVASEQYEKSLENLRRKFAERELDEPLVVADVMGYGQDGRRYGY